MTRSKLWYFSDTMMPPVTIPTFALYGEDHWQSPTGFAHIETIAQRSALHDWAIAPHRHDRAVQLLLVHQGPAQVTLDGALFALDGPAFIVVPTGVVHGFRFDHRTGGHVLTLAQEFVSRANGHADGLGALLTRGGHGTLSPGAAGRVRRLADELIGLDETGGILQVRFPLLKGSRLNIAHAFLQTAWEGRAQVQVVASAPPEAKPDIWHARFEAIDAGMSKVKYWEKLAKHLATLPPVPAKPAA